MIIKYNYKKYIKANKGKLSIVLRYKSGSSLELPINKDGSLVWFDDNKLLKLKNK